MMEMIEALKFKHYLGMCLVVLAFTAPLSYCVVETEKEHKSIQKACVEGKGEWSGAWGGTCRFLPPKEAAQ